MSTPNPPRTWTEKVKVSFSVDSFDHPAPYDPAPAAHNLILTYPEFVKLFMHHEERETKGGKLWAPHHWPDSLDGTPRMEKEALLNVREVQLIVLDLDRVHEDEIERFTDANFEGFGHATHNNRETSPGVNARMILLLDEPVTFVNAVKIRNKIAKAYFDRFDFTAWRYYMPSKPRGYVMKEPDHFFLVGSLVKPGDWL